jgi:hypothetical protein
LATHASRNHASAAATGAPIVAADEALMHPGELVGERRELAHPHSR